MILLIIFFLLRKQLSSLHPNLVGPSFRREIMCTRAVEFPTRYEFTPSASRNVIIIILWYFTTLYLHQEVMPTHFRNPFFPHNEVANITNDL